MSDETCCPVVEFRQYTLVQATEWQRIGNQINAAMIFARSDFVKVD